MPSTFRSDWKPKHTNQLVGESWHDCAFVQAVATAHGVPDFDYTAPIGADNRPLGKSGFKQHLLGMLPLVHNGLIRNIVVVADNDDDHSANFVAVRKAFQDAKGYPTPPLEPCELASNGKGTLRIGIVMLPASKKNGCLETRLLDSAVQSHAHMACVTALDTCCNFPRAKPNVYDKFKLRALLVATITTEPNITLSGIWHEAQNPIDPADVKFKWIADFLKTVFV